MQRRKISHLFKVIHLVLGFFSQRFSSLAYARPPPTTICGYNFLSSTSKQCPWEYLLVGLCDTKEAAKAEQCQFSTFGNCCERGADDKRKDSNQIIPFRCHYFKLIATETNIQKKWFEFNNGKTSRSESSDELKHLKIFLGTGCALLDKW